MRDQASHVTAWSVWPQIGREWGLAFTIRNHLPCRPQVPTSQPSSLTTPNEVVWPNYVIGPQPRLIGPIQLSWLHFFGFWLLHGILLDQCISPKWLKQFDASFTISAVSIYVEFFTSVISYNTHSKGGWLNFDIILHLNSLVIISAC